MMMFHCSVCARVTVLLVVTILKDVNTFDPPSPKGTVGSSSGLELSPTPKSNPEMLSAKQ